MNFAVLKNKNKMGVKNMSVNYIDDSITGWTSQVQESLTRTVAAICRADSNVKKFYIGKASGSNAEEDMRRRYDAYKEDEGINEMRAIYFSNSEKNALAAETYIEDKFKENGKQINRAPGGQGRPGAGPNYYVYVAVRRWG